VWCSVSSAFLTIHDHSHSDAMLDEVYAFHHQNPPIPFVLNADVLRTCASDMKAGGPNVRTAYQRQLSPPHEHDPTMLCHTGSDPVQRPEDTRNIHYEHI
jgi:hypothetical protein